MSLARRSFLRGSAWGVLALLARPSAAVAAKRPLPRVDLDALGRQVVLVPRSAWTERAPRTWRLRIAEFFLYPVVERWRA